MPFDIAAIVLAAGAGTRMRSKRPKVLHSLAGRTLLEHALRAAYTIEPAALVTVVGHGREAVAAEIADIGARLHTPIDIAIQDRQLGTGHAVSCGLSAFGDRIPGTVVITSADVPLLDGATLAALVDTHVGGSAGVTVLTFTPADPGGYGRIVRDETGRVARIVEHADATAQERAIGEVNSGIYAFDGQVLIDALTRLRTDNAQGELYLTDVIGLARAAGRDVLASPVTDPSVVLGVNDRVQLAAAGAALNTRLLERHMTNGVTVVDPATTRVDMDVRIEPDVTLEPGVHLHGATAIAEGAVIGPDTTLTDVEVGAGAQVIRTHADSAIIGPGATVGPFAYLRPGSRLGEAAKVGTFVETKNAQIGAHSKVPHLTYVGDASVGEYSNIGASSVFVNYDGVEKNHTVIGSHVRTGSDNMFVAPVRVGDGAYTGAGTVVRSDVPPGALSVTASDQRIIEGWVLRKRSGTPSAEAAQAALTGRAVTAARPREHNDNGRRPLTQDGEQ